ncbi:MAG: hypothetical protein ABF586_13180, partial [Sporolactobacillus sp.]
MRVLNWLSHHLSEPDYEALLQMIYPAQRARQKEYTRRLLVPLLLALITVIFAGVVRSVLPAVIGLAVAWVIWKAH